MTKKTFKKSIICIIDLSLHGVLLSCSTLSPTCIVHVSLKPESDPINASPNGSIPTPNMPRNRICSPACRGPRGLNGGLNAAALHCDQKKKNKYLYLELFATDTFVFCPHLNQSLPFPASSLSPSRPQTFLSAPSLKAGHVTPHDPGCRRQWQWHTTAHPNDPKDHEFRLDRVCGEQRAGGGAGWRKGKR